MLGACPLPLLHSSFSGTWGSLLINVLALCHTVRGTQLLAARTTADGCTESNYCMKLTDGIVP